jgi:triosephosphate isomerase
MSILGHSGMYELKNEIISLFTYCYAYIQRPSLTAILCISETNNDGKKL